VEGFINFYEKMWISFKVIFYSSCFRTAFTSSSFHLNFAFIWQVGQFSCAEDPSCLVLLICKVVVSGGLGPHLAYSNLLCEVWFSRLPFTVPFRHWTPMSVDQRKPLFRAAAMKCDSTVLLLEGFLVRCPSNKDCAAR